MWVTYIFELKVWSTHTHTPTHPPCSNNNIHSDPRSSLWNFIKNVFFFFGRKLFRRLYFSRNMNVVRERGKSHIQIASYIFCYLRVSNCKLSSRRSLLHIVHLVRDQKVDENIRVKRNYYHKISVCIFVYSHIETVGPNALSHCGNILLSTVRLSMNE